MYYITQLRSYLSTARFAPFCIGFFRMSGTIGKRRAKRAIHLFEKAENNTDAHEFLTYVLFNLKSADTLKKFLNHDEKKLNKDAVSIKSKLEQQNLNKNSIFLTATELFSDFFNVVNFPSVQFKDQFNNITRKFSFKELLNRNSLLSKEILTLKESMNRQIRVEQKKTTMYNR